MQTIPVRVKAKNKEQKKKCTYKRVLKVSLHVVCIALLSAFLILMHSYQIDRAEADAQREGYIIGCNSGFAEGHNLGYQQGYELALGHKITSFAEELEYVENRRKHEDLVVDQASDRDAKMNRLKFSKYEPFELSFWEWISQKASKTGE